MRADAIDGRAEDTGLAAEPVDFVTAGQAFHWFEAARARAEFARLYSAFLDEYDGILRRHAADYAEVRSRRTAALEVENFFAPGPVRHGKRDVSVLPRLR